MQKQSKANGYCEFDFAENGSCSFASVGAHLFIQQTFGRNALERKENEDIESFWMESVFSHWKKKNIDDLNNYKFAISWTMELLLLVNRCIASYNNDIDCVWQAQWMLKR